MSGQTRRDLLKFAGLGALGSSFDPAWALRGFGRGSGVAERPNLLFIMTDQQRWDTLSCAGNSLIATPNIDRLAKSGVRFSEMTCSSPVCGPSRAAVLSGRLFRGHGCEGSVRQFDDRMPGMSPEVETFDEALHGAGYRTEYIGKWHTGIGHQEVYETGLRTHFLESYRAEMLEKYPDATELGDGLALDTYSGLAYRTYPLQEMMRAGGKRHKGKVEKPKIHHGSEAGWSAIPEEDSLTAWTVKRAIDFLERKHEQPFALTCSILHPHSPLVTNGKYIDLVDPAKVPMPRNVFDDENTGQFGVPGLVPLEPNGLGRFIAQYMALISEIDVWVGRLLDTLDRQGLRENTLIVFTSDHGELMGSHGQVGKSRCFEEAIRVPLILSLPGTLPAGAIRTESVSGVDLAPTVLDYCGVTSAERRFDGLSMRAAIDGGDFERKHSPLELNREGMRMRGMRSSEWKLSISERYGQRLYDLQADPLELTNLIAPKAAERTKYLGVAKGLHEDLSEYFAGHDDFLLGELPSLD